MDKNLTNTLSENCMLVRLTVRHTSGIKVDKKLRSGLAEDMKVFDAKLLGVNKHIFGRNINKEFRAILDSIRNTFYKPLTLPWDDSSSLDDEGKSLSEWRLCPNSNLEKLQFEIDQAKLEWDREVQGFLRSYPKQMEMAKRNLGDAFKESDYKPFDELRKDFYFNFEMKPVPTFGNDIRLNVSEKLRQRIEADAINRSNKNIKNVMTITVDALLEQVNHVATKLKEYDPDNKQKGFFNKSSFDKLREAVEVLPSINQDVLGNNQNITDAHQSLCSVLATINSVDSLRDETDLGKQKREQVAEGLEQSIDGLKGNLFDKIYGGKKDDNS